MPATQSVLGHPRQRPSRNHESEIANRLVVAPSRQSVFFFGNGQAEGSGDEVQVLGGKGAGLAEMTNLGIPVPPGFTIACQACDEYLSTGHVPAGLPAAIDNAMRRVEQVTGRKFGNAADPLLVSVRSGAAVSMPGMLETILNLGLNDQTVIGLATKTGNPRFAYDSYRRFLQMYGSVVMGVPSEEFEKRLSNARRACGVENDAEIPADALSYVVAEYKMLVQSVTGTELPMDPRAQLRGAIEAVWNSWTLKKAVDYRRVHNIADTPGTAVSIVAMVFGNFDDESGTGVAFTRNPSTGEPGLYGEFLVNAQGEDVVAGIRTPRPISEMANFLPGAAAEFQTVQATLERHYRDMQDIEFTVERGRLYLLQTRSGKRTVAAAVRVARDMVAEGLIDRDEAVTRVQPSQLAHLLHSVIESTTKVPVLCRGLPASPGAGNGIAVFDADTAEQRAANGDVVILVREETTPDDFHGIVAARAILTARGGMTSHAAVVARGMGKCAVVGCSEMRVDAEKRCFTVGETTIAEGEWITIDGSTGRVFAGNMPTVASEVMRVITGELDAENAPAYEAYHEILGWADEASRLVVRANADTPHDARVARRAGAVGIGLCRTEHMFFEGDRIVAMREMIVARTTEDRKLALAKLLPIQRADFVGIFEAMDGCPVTIRLLDPPLHEFLPHGSDERDALARSAGMPRGALDQMIDSMREANPMLGHRGCRLGITYPEITEMQARAIFEAAMVAKLNGVDARPEIMIPLIATVREFEHQRAIVDTVARDVLGSMYDDVPYLVGTMIELPRAALTADLIAAQADFFSFGTNDLTQTTLGLSRDDAGRFLPYYVQEGILQEDPFCVIDENGVGQLVAMATEKGRRVRPTLKVGICGEHGGDPQSVDFFHRTGLDYVSCSPFRVPVARLAAAHATLGERSAELELAAAYFVASPESDAVAVHW